jgi:hypothetical protein
MLVTVRVAKQSGEDLKEYKRDSRQGNLLEVPLNGLTARAVGLLKKTLSKLTVINAGLRKEKNGLRIQAVLKSIKQGYAHVVPKGRQDRLIIVTLAKLQKLGNIEPRIRIWKGIELDTMHGMRPIKNMLSAEERQISFMHLKRFVGQLQTMQLHLVYLFGNHVRFATA